MRGCSFAGSGRSGRVGSARGASFWRRLVAVIVACPEPGRCVHANRCDRRGRHPSGSTCGRGELMAMLAVGLAIVPCRWTVPPQVFLNHSLMKNAQFSTSVSVRKFLVGGVPETGSRSGVAQPVPVDPCGSTEPGNTVAAPCQSGPSRSRSPNSTAGRGNSQTTVDGSCENLRGLSS
jgi:hypothetical protein